MAYNEMNGSVASIVQNHTTLSQAQLYAIQHMNMYDIIEGLRDAIGYPENDRRIPLFEYYRTDVDTESPRLRQRLPNGVPLDLTFNNGLFALLRKMFDIEGREIEVYDRRKINRSDGKLNPHVRQIVLLVRGRGRGRL
jgi:hypothetical protein